MHLTLAGGSLWRKQMSVCGHKRAPVEHVILFLSSGDFVSEVWVLWNALGGVPIRVSISDTRWHTRLMRWAKSTRALFSREWSAFTVSLFLWESSALVHPFSQKNWGDHLPPAARVQPLLRQWRDWVRGDRRWSLRTSLREEFFISLLTAADESKLREEDVLSVTSSDPAGSALLAHGGLMKVERIFLSLLSLYAPRCRAAGGYEACASARLDLQWRHEKGGVARSRLDERSLSGITSQLPWASHSFQIFIVRSCRHGINHIQPASIGISMLIMLTTKGGVSADMHRCPLGALASYIYKKKCFNLDRVFLGFLSFKRVLLLNSLLSRAPFRPHYWCIGSIVSLAIFL